MVLTRMAENSERNLFYDCKPKLRARVDPIHRKLRKASKLSRVHPGWERGTV
jgi:hypothetical protein